MSQPRLVQAVDRCDPLDPSFAPFRQPHLAGRAVDKIPPHVAPAPREGHQAAEQARQLLVCAVAVADDDRVEEGLGEQLLRRLGTAARIDMEVDCVTADRGPEPGPARTAGLAKRLDAPCGLVDMAQSRFVLVREDRIGQRLEQRHEAGHTVGQRPGRDQQPPIRQPRPNPVERAEAAIALEQETRPHADPVERVVEQPRHRRRRHFQGRGRAVTAPAPAGTDDPACVGSDLALDDGGFLGTVWRIGLSATRAHPRILRRVELFHALLEPGPLGAAMAGGAGLLAARAFRARPLLLLALSPEQRLGQHRAGRTKPGKLRFQRLDPTPRRLRGLAQPGVLPGQGLDRSLLAPRSPQGVAQLSGLVRQRPRQRLGGRAMLAEDRALLAIDLSFDEAFPTLTPPLD